MATPAMDLARNTFVTAPGSAIFADSPYRLWVTRLGFSQLHLGLTSRIRIIALSSDVHEILGAVMRSAEWCTKNYNRWLLIGLLLAVGWFQTGSVSSQAGDLPAPTKEPTSPTQRAERREAVKKQSQDVAAPTAKRDAQTDPATKPEAKDTPKPRNSPNTKMESKPATKPAIASDAQPAPKPESKADAKPKQREGHSYHGEAFNEGPRQRGYLMGNVGNAHFPITTQSPEAQKYFDQGINQQHGFWYFEAERSFREAALRDPQCAMAYWGMALANINNENRAKGFIRKAVENKPHVSRREHLWIDALEQFLKGGDDQARRRKFLKQIEGILHEYPDELEAKAFLAWMIWVNTSHKLPIDSYQAVDSLIGDVLRLNPYHPGAHHYRIHLWDSERPARALTSAALNGQAAPGIAHLWHMPGHTYSYVRRYVDGAWQQEASARVDHAYMMRDRVMPYQIHNYAHNNEWLIRNLQFLGCANKAIVLSKNLIEVPRHPKHNMPTDRNSCAGFGRGRLLDTLVYFELWDELVAVSQAGYLDPLENRDQDLDLLEALGRAQAQRRDAAGLSKIVAELEQLLKSAEEKKTSAGKEAESKARDEKKTPEQITKAKDDAEKRHAANLKKYKDALAGVKAFDLLAQGKAEEALPTLTNLRDLSKPQLALIQLAAGKNTDAENTARNASQGDEHKVIPLAIYVEVLHRLGKTREAQEKFQKLRQVAAHADATLPALQRLTPLAAAAGLKGDWRLPPERPDDVGVRPNLDALGKLRWQPVPTPTWSANNPNGKVHVFGPCPQQPTVVLCYLGAGCVHCVEQLTAFAKESKNYSQANIAVVAISTENSTALKASLGQLAEKGFLFPLLADPQYQVFKAYRAYDDFEKQPLHATLFIDTKGLIRWQDSGFEPFANPAFLLKEIQRLRKLPD